MLTRTENVDEDNLFDEYNHDVHVVMDIKTLKKSAVV